MMTIGEFSRASGLSVSALRFYDRVSALVPVQVDPRTSYRWYAPSQVGDGRLVARLRRVGLPVAEMKLLIDRRDDPTLVSALLAEHLQRLEEGLVSARAELARIRADVGDRSGPVETGTSTTEFSLQSSELLAALASVRFALPEGPDPALGAILFDIGPTSVTLVASDRYRMAVSELLVGDRRGPLARAAVPQDRLPELERFLSGEGTVSVQVCGQVIRWTKLGRQLELELSPEEFPEYRSIVSIVGTRRVITDVESVRTVLESGPVAQGAGIDGSPVDVAILTANTSGALVALPDADTEDCVVVNVDFLLEAMDANPAGQLVLDFSSPITPLAIRFPHRPGTFSVLMPTHLA
jgi:DNA polymerase III subunit beta